MANSRVAQPMLALLGNTLVIAAVWFAYLHLLAYFWSWYAAGAFVFDWAIDTFLPDHRVAYYLFIYTHDVIVNTALALPVAWLLCRFWPGNLWLSVTAAVLAVFIVNHAPLLMMERPEGVSLARILAINALMEVLPMLAAYGIASHVSRRRATSRPAGQSP